MSDFQKWIADKARALAGESQKKASEEFKTGYTMQQLSGKSKQELEYLGKYGYSSYVFPKKTVCVFGAASDNISRKKKKQAYAVGKLLGVSGHRLVYGAGSTGVMGQVAKGYADADPPVRAFGSTTAFLRDIEKPSEDINLIVSKDMADRKELYHMADIVLVMPGGNGTLDELFEFLTYKQLAALAKKNGKQPVTWDGTLLLWKEGGVAELLVKLWESCYAQHMAPHWSEFVQLVGFGDLADILHPSRPPRNEFRGLREILKSFPTKDPKDHNTDKICITDYLGTEHFIDPKRIISLNKGPHKSITYNHTNGYPAYALFLTDNEFARVRNLLYGKMWTNAMNPTGTSRRIGDKHE